MKIYHSAESFEYWFQCSELISGIPFLLRWCCFDRNYCIPPWLNRFEKELFISNSNNGNSQCNVSDKISSVYNICWVIELQHFPPVI